MSICSIPRKGFFEVGVFQQKVTAPLLAGLLLQLGEVALFVCLCWAGQGHTGLGEGPADSAAPVPSLAVSGPDPQQELPLQSCPGSPEGPWTLPPSRHWWPSSPLQLQERMELGGLKAALDLKFSNNVGSQGRSTTRTVPLAEEASGPAG